MAVVNSPENSTKGETKKKEGRNNVWEEFEIIMEMSSEFSTEN